MESHGLIEYVMWQPSVFEKLCVIMRKHIDVYGN